jgi:hypothetical protein
MKLKALQKRIKGGGTNHDEQNEHNFLSDLKLTTVDNDGKDENDWCKADDRTEISFLCKLNYKEPCNDSYLIIPNQEYEYTKILRTFLKDKKNFTKINEDTYGNESKTANLFRDKTQPYQKLWLNDSKLINTHALLKRQMTDSCKDFFEIDCNHDSLDFHQQLFQNNWDLLLNVYSFCKYDTMSSSSANSDSMNHSSIISSLSGFSSIGSSTRSTNLNESRSTFSIESAKSRSLDEFKMYVDSIGVTANREIIIKGSISDKIKGGLEKHEAVCFYLIFYFTTKFNVLF